MNNNSLVNFLIIKFGSRKTWVAISGVATALCALLQVDPTVSANIVALIVAIGAFASTMLRDTPDGKDTEDTEETSNEKEETNEQI